MKPRLIHPVNVSIFRRAEGAQDPEFGSRRPLWAQEVILKGQISWVAFEKLTPAGAGDAPACEGHIVFYASDWAAVGAGKGDEMSCDGSGRLVIVEVSPKAHYTGQPQHVHVGFVRRRGA